MDQRSPRQVVFGQPLPRKSARVHVLVELGATEEQPDLVPSVFTGPGVDDVRAREPRNGFEGLGHADERWPDGRGDLRAEVEEDGGG